MAYHHDDRLREHDQPQLRGHASPGLAQLVAGHARDPFYVVAIVIDVVIVVSVWGRVSAAA